MANMTMRLETEVKDVYQFIFGGKSEFTIENTDSKKGYKYKVTKCKDKDNLFFVKVKDGESYEYAGYMTINADGKIQYKQGQKGPRDFDDEAIKGLAWAIRKGHNPLPHPMIMMHHGKCACCGKKLDDAESVARGIGPVCWDRIQKKEWKKVTSEDEMPFE